MTTKQNIQLRDARDRLSELLGLGEPYPLRDLPVPAKGLTVPFGQAVKIPVEYSQRGVSYQLHDNRNRPETRPSDGGDVPVQADGTGDEIRLETPNIEDDITYRILATKISSDREAYLHASAVVKVGLDMALIAWIRNQPALDPTVEPVLPTTPRLADYEDTVEVEIKQSQEGVDYRLIHFVNGEGTEAEEIELSVADVRGTSGSIVLQSKPVLEDTILRIRATKTFAPSEGREDQTDLLDIELPLKVKANRAIDVSILPAAIVDFATEATVRIAASQRSAQYRVYVHKIRDPEFVHAPASDAQVIRVRLADEPEVQVSRPELPEPWEPVVDYDTGSDFRTGNGVDLDIAIGQITNDSLILVEARKEHQVLAEQAYASCVWLLQPVVFLARPNPTPPLNLSVVMQGDTTDDRLRAEEGQPGVFYYFRTAVDGEELPLPAYFHQRDDIDSHVNKGIGQLEVGIDLAVANDPAVPVDRSANRASLKPEPPVLEAAPLSAETTFYIRAMKAQTCIVAQLTHTAQLAALPQIRLQQAGVVAGGVARVLVQASHVGDQYALMLGGEAVRPPLPGDGTDKEFVTDAMAVDTMFEVWVTRPGETGIPVKRIVRLPVLIRPNATLVVKAAATEVEHNSATEILIESSQMDVSYQLLVAGSKVGSADSGNGATLNFPTGPLTADTTFVVRASRMDDSTITVELAQTVAITVRPAAP